ncbi:MAG TPA: TetR/AcrR family transcriptional regulator [Myxococcota bacterium]|nr:TetR/AcrR family transcriptional regulator [Myxococcota bacterium]
MDRLDDLDVPARLETVARPKQARSARTLQRLLDAAEALIEENGLAEVSVPEIARSARSSVGGFYARFRDKNELLRALEERFFREQRVRLERLTKPETWGDASLPSIVRACMRELVDVFRLRRALIHAFVARAVVDVEFRGEALRFEREVADKIGALLLTRPGAIGHPRPERAVELAVGIVFGSMIAGVLFGDTTHAFAQLSDEEAADELARNFLGYLDVRDVTRRKR